MKFFIINMCVFCSYLMANDIIYVTTLFDGYYTKNQFKNFTNELTKQNIECLQSENEFKCDISNEELFINVKKIEDKFKINTYKLEKDSEATLGIKIEKLKDKFIISHIYQNTQALERLQKNDIILSIDNIDLTPNMTMYSVLDLLNGENNSVVLLNILRGENIINRTVKRKLESSISKTINYHIDDNILFMNIENIHKDMILKYDTLNQLQSILNANKDIRKITLDLSFMSKNSIDYSLLKPLLSAFLRENTCLFTIIDNNGKNNICTKGKPLINNKITIEVILSNKTNYQGLIFAYLLKKHYLSKVEINLPKLLNLDKTINLHKRSHLDKFYFIYPNGLLELN